MIETQQRKRRGNEVDDSKADRGKSFKRPQKSLDNACHYL
jgi:hypothetical protein